MCSPPLNNHKSAGAPSLNRSFIQGWEITNLNRVVTGTASAGYYSGAQMSWSYDPFGNRKSESVSGTATVPMPSTSTASYTATSNQVSSVNNGAGLVYDASGDVTQDPLNSYLYDAEGRLCAAKTAGPSLTGYVYDASGTRVAKGSLTSFSCNFAANGFTPTTSWVLGPGGEQVTEYAVSGGTSNWVHTNAFSGGKIQATYDGTDTTFYLGDWLGTKRVEVGASGCATAYASLAYGDGLTTVSLPGYTACASDATEHHFTGKERDTESGNDYFGARYYASSMGRFMSPDWSAKVEPVPYAKLDNPQSLNLYAYVGNNPMTRTDPTGHTCKSGDTFCHVWDSIFHPDRLPPTPPASASNPPAPTNVPGATPPPAPAATPNPTPTPTGVQISVGVGGTIIAPSAGGSASANVGINFNWWDSSIFIQGQANGGFGGGAFAGYGLTLNGSNGADPTTGFGSADYAEGDLGIGPGLTGSVAHDEKGTAYGGGWGLRGGEGAGAGFFAGKQGTATLATPSLGSIMEWFADHQQYF